MKCDFCHCNKLTEVYKVPTSKIEATIMSCDSCGLLQSSYGDKTKKHTNKSLSSDADWGNIRHGKKIRLSKSIKILEKFVNFDELKYILDIGSNRGDFIEYMGECTSATIDAIEPDITIISNYPQKQNITIHNLKFEKYVTDKKFDLIYCCHTLEHANSASSMLINSVNLLKDNGYIYIDVPSIDVLLNSTNVQEFFIDKHTFHFSLEILKNYLKLLGLEIIYEKDDGFNIVILSKKINKSRENTIKITKYEKKLKSNRKKLQKICSNIHKLIKNKKSVIYGASQILNALIKYGNLNIEKIDYVIDDYLHEKINDINGKKIENIESIDWKDVDIVIILARSAISSIKTKLKKKNISQIISFDELVN